jgi:glycosyltransferase involved in cell wall biosynthesis
MKTKNPKVSVVVPAYNVAATIIETLHSIFNQTFRDFEIIVVDDGSTDGTPALLNAIQHSALQVVRQSNRGLAGARNTGLFHSTGEYVAFCDSDDVWEPEKLDLHVRHLDDNPQVGISYAGSSLIDDNGKFLKTAQRPKLGPVSAADIFKRNPIGNGSAPVVRKAAFDAISYWPTQETERRWWFDETLRQSEDIDAWLRFALATDWKIEGIPGLLTRYRINSGGLSANLAKQYETWLRVRKKVEETAPHFAASVANAAEAYQLRFLARRAFMMRDSQTCKTFALKSLSMSLVPLREEPRKTLETFAAGLVLGLMGKSPEKMKSNLLARV